MVPSVQAVECPASVCLPPLLRRDTCHQHRQPPPLVVFPKGRGRQLLSSLQRHLSCAVKVATFPQESLESCCRATPLHPEPLTFPVLQTRSMSPPAFVYSVFPAFSWWLRPRLPTSSFAVPAQSTIAATAAAADHCALWGPVALAVGPSVRLSKAKAKFCMVCSLRSVPAKENQFG